MTAIWTAPATMVDGVVQGAAWFNQYLKDNLEWLKGRPYVQEQDFDGTFFTTSSATFQDTGADAALTTTGGRVMVVCWGTILVASTSTNGYLTIYEDGVNKGDATAGMQTAVQNSPPVPFSMVYITPVAPTAAAHTWKVYLRSSSGAANVSITQYQMWAIEIGA
jgi:hypothetical protein